MALLSKTTWRTRRLKMFLFMFHKYGLSVILSLHLAKNNSCAYIDRQKISIEGDLFNLVWLDSCFWCSSFWFCFSSANFLRSIPFFTCLILSWIASDIYNCFHLFTSPTNHLLLFLGLFFCNSIWAPSECTGITRAPLSTFLSFSIFCLTFFEICFLTVSIIK